MKSEPEYVDMQLIELACQHYNIRNPDKPPATVNSSPRFVKRICVNYLRHACTDYDAGLTAFYRSKDSIEKSRIGEMVCAHSVAIFESLASKHPWLRGECNRQANPMKMKLERCKRRRERRESGNLNHSQETCWTSAICCSIPETSPAQNIL
jgi:hypothetical protein